MSLITVLLIILICGFFVYLVNVAEWIHPWFKKAFIGIVCIFLLIYLLQGFGLLTGFALRV